MTEAKFKKNVPRSVTTSNISIFSTEEDGAKVSEKDLVDDLDELIPKIQSSSDIDE